MPKRNFNEKINTTTLIDKTFYETTEEIDKAKEKHKIP